MTIVCKKTNDLLYSYKSIYPLIIFIFMALDKAHRTRGSRPLHRSEWSDFDGNGFGGTVAANIVANVEQSPMLAPRSHEKLDLDA